MADGGLYFIDVTVKPCAYIKDVIDGSWSSIQEGSKKVNANVIHGFKVNDTVVANTDEIGIGYRMTIVTAATTSSFKIARCY